MATSQTPRTFEVPAALVASGHSPLVDLDHLDREVEFPGDFGDWAEGVLFQENAKILASVCGDMRLLPRGILASVQLDDASIIIAGLIDSEGGVWDKELNSWIAPTEDVDVETETVILDDDEVAFVARALLEGADSVWCRPVIPKAFVSAIVAAPTPPSDRTGKKAKQPKAEPTGLEVPAGSAIVAVVDPIDEDAVLEMLAIAPGPRVLRRHDGNWFEDPAWVSVLTSVRPPKIVKLDEAQVASVSTQVDRSTDEQEWEPFEVDDREQYQIFTASAYLDDLLKETQQQAITALLAVAGKELSPKDVANTERLKRYWTIGEGAAKIRWGTPGSWTRCHKHLSKYMNPKMVPGYCTNLSKRLGGPGVATHVASSIEAVTAANPTGKNGYDSGMSFEESTKGVERDSNGRFAIENGGGGGRNSGRFRGESSTGRSGRDERRRASIARSRKAREEKASKEKTSTKDKADREAEKAKKAAQQQELADMSLRISELSAAGDTIGAAELRVERAQKVLSFADTQLAKTRAQTSLNNARAALARARVAEARKRTKRAGTSANLRSREANIRAQEAKEDDADE